MTPEEKAGLLKQLRAELTNTEHPVTDEVNEQEYFEALGINCV